MSKNSLVNFGFQGGRTVLVGVQLLFGIDLATLPTDA